MGITEHLKLDVMRADHVTLNQHVVIAERVPGFAPRCF